MIESIARLFDVESLRLEESQEAGTGYWQSTVVDSTRTPRASGFSGDRQQARKIATAELLERKMYFQLQASNEIVRKSWGLDIHPTACGFAGGFDLINTTQRSLSEAVERWVMSLWIDDGFKIDPSPTEQILATLDPVSRFFANQFDQVLFFEKRVTLNFDRIPKTIVVAQTMGLKDGGIFPGSSAQVSDGGYWQHALLESYRHLMGVKNNPARIDKFPDNKVHFFANNAQVALDQIVQARNPIWPEPKLLLQKSILGPVDQFYVARTIIDGWRNWSEGPLARFLY